MVPARVSLVTLGARNIPALRRFYQNLGWGETETSSDQYAVFHTAGVMLSLYPLAELAKDTGVTLPEGTDAFRAITLAVNVDKPADVDLAVTDAEVAGARILRRASDASWGGRIAYFADPENNLWEVAWNPTAVFDECGAMISF